MAVKEHLGCDGHNGQVGSESNGCTLSRQLRLLRALNDKLPSRVLADLFDTTDEQLTKWRGELDLPSPNGNRLISEFLSSEQAPHFDILSYDEQKRLYGLWVGKRVEQAERAQARRKKKERALIARLVELQKTRQAEDPQPLVSCGRRGCEYQWRREPDFFDRDRSAKDGLATSCKICEFRRRRSEPKNNRRKPLMLTEHQRAYWLTVIADTEHEIPARFMEAAFGIRRNLLSSLRRECGVKVKPSESVKAYLRWIALDSMPPTPRLYPWLRAKLEEVWSAEKKAYEEWLQSEVQCLADQEIRMRQLWETLRLEPNQCPREFVLAPCWGPYCRGKKSWPLTDEFFFIKGEKNEKSRCCHACDYCRRRFGKFYQRQEEANAEVAEVAAIEKPAEGVLAVKVVEAG